MVDKAQIRVKAGDGGDGIAHFRHEKFAPKGGPDGGDGGKGGSVFLVTDPNLNTLKDFRHKTLYQADDGQNGMGSRKTGKNREDIEIKVPVGTLIYELEGKNQKLLFDLDKPEIRLKIVRGGYGGRGNWHFRSATHQTPREFERGQKGEEKELLLELKLLADVGIIGLPSAGKSTLLSVLTKARPKIAPYHFTTLEPNLGVFKRAGGRDLVLADIPGLIEGASQGKGLGDEFLRHIQRTRFLIHLLAIDIHFEDQPSWDWTRATAKEIYQKLVADYRVVRQELSVYDPKLTEKKEIVLLNKIDLLTSEQLKGLKKKFVQDNLSVYLVSTATLAGIDDFKKALEKIK